MDLEVELLGHGVDEIYINLLNNLCLFEYIPSSVSHTIYTTNESKCNLLINMWGDF